MSREEIVNNIGYQLTRAAVDYIEKHEFADGMDCFEAGDEWMQKKMIGKACEWLKENIDLYTYISYSRESGHTKITLTDEFETAFRKAMEE
jgi:hypothetical protein